MNKRSLRNKKGLIVTSIAGSSNSEENEETEPNSSGQRSTRKRIKNADDFSTEEATTKKIRFDSSVGNADSTNLKTNDEVELNSDKIFSKSIDDLPPEMIKAILKHLTTGDLLRSRQVNRKWNDLSTQILRYREDMKFMFRFKGEQFVKRGTSKSLKKFVHCFRKSNRSFGHFDFGYLKYFGNEDINNFLTTEGKFILSLGIIMNVSQKDVKTLRKLLLLQVPDLKKLIIEFGYSVPNQVLPGDQFKLPKLEVLVVNNHNKNKNYCSIVGDILTAACNLKRLEMTDYIKVKDLILLQSLNKLHCLKSLKIYLSVDLIDNWSNFTTTMNLKLEYLHLSFEDIWENDLDATSIIKQLLESTKDVIRTLAMEPIGFLPSVVFPKLEKLYKLVIITDDNNTEYFRPLPQAVDIFPPLFEIADIFPNLKELDVSSMAEIKLSPHIMPSVETLRILYNTSIETLTKMVPNVKTLFLHQRHPSSYNANEESFVDGIRAIFKNLTKLEKFEWKITESSYLNLMFSLDSVMTGLTESFCKKKSVKYQKKNKLSSNELTSMEGRREFCSIPSILDLKDLKKLDINFFFGIRQPCKLCRSPFCDGSDYDDDDWIDDEIDAGFAQTSKFYRTGFTKVSQFLAFQLMPNLEVRITKNFD